jgi:hypothetical protein
MRVGAIPELQIRDLIPKSIGPNGEILDGDSGIEKLYQILVYERSHANRYYTFCTPECRQSIDKYLASRADKGEDVFIPNNKNTAPLIREQFSEEDVLKPEKLSVYTFKKAIGRTIKRARLKTTGGEVAMTHGFRKFAITQMIKSKVDYEVREFVSGHRHSRGLDVSYDRSEVKDRLLEWSKAINLLTINEELRLTKQLKAEQGENAQKITELEAQLLTIQEQLFHATGRTVGFKDKPMPNFKIAEGKMTEITEEEWRKENQKWIDKQQPQPQPLKPTNRRKGEKKGIS